MQKSNNITNGKWSAISKIAMNAGGIALAAGALWMFSNYVSNHSNASTKALIKLEAAIDSSVNADKEQTEVLRDLKTLIEIKLR